jgi:hypothetical protein
LRTILHPHRDAARDGIPDVADLATLGLDDRLYALRPPLAGLKNESAEREALKPNYFHPSLIGGPDLIRFVV